MGIGEDESELEMVRRHVREGAAAVERQRAIVSELEADGLSIDVAVTLLSQFEAIQAQHEAHLERILAKGS